MCAVRAFALFLGLAALSVCTATADSMGALRNAEFMNRANQGFTEVLNLDFDAADRDFTALANRCPDHPAPPLYLATILWLRLLDERQELSLDRFVHPSYFTESTSQAVSPALRQRFVDLTGKSRLLAERRLESSPRDHDARYLRGATEGLLAAFALTVDRSYLRAFSHGKQAYAIHRRLIDDDRQYYDACMLVGLYGYIASNLPWYLRWLAAVTGLRGEKQRALDSLNLAVEKGIYVSDDARVLRMTVLVREGRLGEARGDAAALFAKYPRNYVFQLTQAQMMNRMGDREAAADTYLQVLRFAEEGKPNYQRIGLAAFRWEVAEVLLASKPQAALERYQALLEDPSLDGRRRVLSTLRLGCAFDLLGRRDDAIWQYKGVLSMQDYDNAHAHADEYLKSPYVGAPNTVGRFRLAPR